jgi:hypothetical protein
VRSHRLSYLYGLNKKKMEIVGCAGLCLCGDFQVPFSATLLIQEKSPDSLGWRNLLNKKGEIS